MNITADMASTVWRIVVGVGDTVAAGAAIVILESMKMEIPVLAPIAGVVAAIDVAEGQVVEAGAVLARIERSA